MKFKLNHILKEFTTVLARFPLAILSAVAGTIMAILFVDNYDSDYLIRAILVCSLGLPLFTTIKLFVERQQKSLTFRLILSAVAVAGLVGYFFYLNGNDIGSLHFVFQFFILHLVLLCCISIAAYTPSKDVMSFAKFNSSIFLHVLESFITSLILFAALALALFALDSLFGVPIDGNVYSRLFIFIVGIFNSIYILSGIKEGFDYTEIRLQDNRLFKILSQYILIPVVLIYTVILYAYSIKVLLSADETNEWVASMILWFFVAGVFTYLMNYVFRNDENAVLGRTYLKWFFIVALPLLILLFYVSYVNVKKGGVTPEFYFAFLLGIWLLGISIYLLLSKHDDIRWIPISLIAVGLFSIFSPWSICRVTVESQMNRLVSELESVGIIKDGKLTDTIAAGSYSEQTRRSIRYLDEFQELNRLKKFDTDHIFPEEINSNDLYDRFMDGAKEETNIIEIPFEESPEIDIRGYDVLVQADLNQYLMESSERDITMRIKDPMSVEIIKDGKIVLFDLSDFINAYPLTQNRVFIGKQDDLSVKIFFQNLVTGDRSGNLYINYGKAFILLKEGED